MRQRLKFRGETKHPLLEKDSQINAVRMSSVIVRPVRLAEKMTDVDADANLL